MSDNSRMPTNTHLHEHLIGEDLSITTGTFLWRQLTSRREMETDFLGNVKIAIGQVDLGAGQHKNG